MKKIETVAKLQSLIVQEEESNKSVGFVPTMGALHAGHMALVERCRRENDFCIVSIFVNPTQFNNTSDLEHYPRTLEADCALLQAAGVDVVFVPTVREIYPQQDTRQFHFGALEQVMEGAHRPGHFNGVAQVVSKFFTMIMPDRAYFGEKDFQQLVIIKAMVKQLHLSVKIVPCPIVREKDGLAMSSRNARLTAEQRQVAPFISTVLQASKIWQNTCSVEEVRQKVLQRLKKQPLLKVEYFDIVNAATLQHSANWEEEGEKLGCVAVFLGDIRLIDNVMY